MCWHKLVIVLRELRQEEEEYGGLVRQWIWEWIQRGDKWDLESVFAVIDGEAN